MGLVRLNPLKESPDRENKFRVFGNTEAYLLTKEDKKELYQHGLVKKDEPPSLEYVQEWIDTMTFPMKLKVSDLDWSSFFRINERIANGFRRGRAFLAGGTNERLLNTYLYIVLSIYCRCCSLSFTGRWSRYELGTSRW